MTSVLISRLIKNHASLYFYDECTFNMGDFQKKYWRSPADNAVLHLRNPTLRLKLNVILSESRLIAFELSLASHKQRDVEEFVMRVMHGVSAERDSETRKYLVMDNNPKNRSARLLNFVKKSNFGVIFITPGSPEHNMAENFFLALKRTYLKLANLKRINHSEDSQTEAIKVVFEALKLVDSEKFSSIRKSTITI